MNYSLKSWNTFGVNRYAKNIVYVKSVQQLLKAWQDATQNGQPVLILGMGSNVLFLENFIGTVIINRIMGISINEKNNAWHLHIGAGENWHQLVKFNLKHNIPGLENLALIPGCAGSSPIQNISAYGVEFKQVCEYVDCIELVNGKIHRFYVEECYFGYRDSIFKHKYLGHIAIIAVGLLLYKSWQPILTYGDLVYLNPDKVTPKQIFDVVCHMRMTKIPDPKLYGNAGSFFKNPIISIEFLKLLLIRWPDIQYSFQKNGNVKLSAGWLIDKCNLKGITYGGAEVYHRQALVLINKNNATSKDILQLARLIRQQVGRKFNIWLEPEVCFIGHSGKINVIEAMQEKLCYSINSYTDYFR